MTQSSFTIPDTEFARTVVAECPEFAEPGVDDLRRVTQLRHWAWSHTDYAPSAESARVFQSDDAWVQSDAPEHFARFEQLQGGVICGGAAKGLRKLYTYFGYRAWSFGCLCEPDGPSHAVALVEIDVDGTKKIVVQDASYNVALHDAESNAPLSFVEVLARLRERRHESIRAVESDYLAIKRWPRFVVTPQFAARHTLEHCLAKSGYVIEGVAKAKTLDDGTIVIESPRSWRHFIEKKCYDRQTRQPALMLKEIVDRGYPESMLYLYRTPQWLEGPDRDPIWRMACDAATGPEG